MHYQSQFCTKITACQIQYVAAVAHVLSFQTLENLLLWNVIGANKHTYKRLHQESV